jgi:hypothetical protein
MTHFGTASVTCTNCQKNIKALMEQFEPVVRATPINGSGIPGLSDIKTNAPVPPEPLSAQIQALTVPLVDPVRIFLPHGWSCQAYARPDQIEPGLLREICRTNESAMLLVLRKP